MGVGVPPRSIYGLLEKASDTSGSHRETSEDPDKGMGKGVHKQVKTSPSEMVAKCVIEV